MNNLTETACRPSAVADPGDSSVFRMLLLIPALFSAATALSLLVQLPAPLAWATFAGCALLAVAGLQRRSLSLLTAAWLGFLGLSGVMAGYVADELNRGVSLMAEGLSLGLGLGLLLVLTLQPQGRR